MAVADAGGPGYLAVTWRSLDGTRAVVAETREATDRPFAVNLALDDRTTHRPTGDTEAWALYAGQSAGGVDAGSAGEGVQSLVTGPGPPSTGSPEPNRSCGRRYCLARQ